MPIAKHSLLSELGRLASDRKLAHDYANDPKRTAVDLYIQNAAANGSMDSRYCFSYQPTNPTAFPIPEVTLAHLYAYQDVSSNHVSWPQSFAKHVTDALIADIARPFLEKLEGFKAAHQEALTPEPQVDITQIAPNVARRSRFP